MVLILAIHFWFVFTVSFIFVVFLRGGGTGGRVGCVK